jgi:hypothetical protein
MITKENYVMGKHIYLEEEKCLDVIEAELGLFFDIRLKSIHLISELYIKGYLRSLDDILTFLNISNDEIKTLIETVVYKISSNINSTLAHETIYFNIDSLIANYIQYIENNIDEFTKTEKVLGICEKFLDESLSKMFETCFQSKVLTYVFDQSNLSAKILSNHSLKKQKQKHSEIILNQIKGLILNLKCELRNDLVKSALLSIYTYEENSATA